MMAVAGVVQFLREQVVRAELETVTDAQLLQRYIAERDEDAFAALVRRHAAMVWGVCKRVLGHDQDAEDAFQATFMVLVRKAASVRPQSLLGHWLYGVANQVAVKGRAMNAKRMSREKQLPLPIANAAAKADVWQELQPLLDQELSLLPEKYRVIILLCDLEGRTRKEAACCLGVPEGTVAGRQARAWAMLAKRLARHGFAVGGGSLAALLSQAAASAAPASAVASTIKSASVLAAGGSIAANLAVLTEGVVKAMFMNQLKSALTMILVILGLGIAAFGVGVLAQGQPNRQPPDLNFVAKEQDGQAEKPKEAGPLPAQPKQEPGKTDQERMVGSWVIMNDDSLRKGEKWIIREDRFLMGVNLIGGIDKLLRFHRLDASKNPKQIDITFKEQPNGKPLFNIKGIYALDGDELRISLGDVGKDRPAAFAKKPGPGELLIFQRVDPSLDK
jgi:RNA polymerase sigma factor (sigma-70 family)